LFHTISGCKFLQEMGSCYSCLSKGGLKDDDVI
jgi:hypothetical protein